MQLYSVDQKRSQALEAHAAAFSTLKVCMLVQSAEFVSRCSTSLTALLMTWSGLCRPLALRQRAQ